VWPASINKSGSKSSIKWSICDLIVSHLPQFVRQHHHHMVNIKPVSIMARERERERERERDLLLLLASEVFA